MTSVGLLSGAVRHVLMSFLPDVCEMLICITSTFDSCAAHSKARAVEYCDWETFNATCPADQVIAIISARYGRMNLGRCVSTNYGSIGCGADVTSHLEAACSGNRACALSVISLSQQPLQTSAPCPPEFKYYLEAEYECLKVYSHVNASMPNCPAPILGLSPSPVTLTGTSVGLLASAVTMETGLGGPSCPWVIRVEPYQRINVTLLDFSVQPPAHRIFQQQQPGGGPVRAGIGHSGHQYRASQTGWEYGGDDTGPAGHGTWPNGANCDEYALITEDVDQQQTATASSGVEKNHPAVDVAVGSSQRRNATVCGRRRRQSVVYVSESNVIQVRLNPSSSRQYKFVLKYEAFGCPPFVAPPGAWVTNVGRHVYVQCNETSGGADEETTKWRLTCRGTTWHGHVGNCTGNAAASSQLASLDRSEDDWVITEMFSNSAGFPFGILFVIALGVLIGVIAGVLMLLAVLAYMRQRKLRKVRSRSSYVLHDTETTTGSAQSYDAHSKSGNNGNSFVTHMHPTPIYRPFLQDNSNDGGGVLGTWQRTRPLPVPSRPSRMDTGSRDSCADAVDDDDDEDDNVIAMTPLTSTSEHPLLTPTTDGDAELFGINTVSSGINQREPVYAPNAVRNYVSSQRRPNDASCYQHQQQPIDATHLLLIGAQCSETATAACTGGGGYERCVVPRECASQQPPHGNGAPYYFKLDLTAGLATTPGEHMTGSSASQCLMCLHQQQQQRGGTLQRHQPCDNARGSACPALHGGEQRY